MEELDYKIFKFCVAVLAYKYGIMAHGFRLMGEAMLYVNRRIDRAFYSRRIEKIRDPLVRACVEGRLKDVKLLLRRGRDPNTHDGSSTLLGCRPLHRAVRCGYTKVARALLEAGADPDAREGTSSVAKSPLEEACMYVNAAPRHLTLAAADSPLTPRYGQAACFDLLVEHGADVHSFGVVPLAYVAGFEGFDDIVRSIRAAGGDLSAVDSEGLTGLNEAAHTGCPSTAGVFLELGVDPNRRCKETPLETAARSGAVDVAFVLRCHGADAGPVLRSWWPRTLAMTAMLQRELSAETKAIGRLVGARVTIASTGARGRVVSVDIDAHLAVVEVVPSAQLQRVEPSDLVRDGGERQGGGPALVGW